MSNADWQLMQDGLLAVFTPVVISFLVFTLVVGTLSVVFSAYMQLTSSRD